MLIVGMWLLILMMDPTIVFNFKNQMYVVINNVLFEYYHILFIDCDLE